jgi:hypothetical protein
VHCERPHGAIPSTQPVRAETNVTESGWNPDGTGLGGAVTAGSEGVGRGELGGREEGATW